MKKDSVIFIGVLVLIVTLVLPAFAQETVVSPLVNDLEEMEQILYGVPQSGSVLNRTEKLEKDLIGDTLSGTLMERVNTLKTFILAGTPEEPSLAFKTKAIRLSLNIQTSVKGILTAELEEFENLIFGMKSNESIGVRVDRLFKTVVDPNKTRAFQVTIPAHTLVKVTIQTELNSEKNNVGDPVPYSLTEDFKFNDVLIAPAGTSGEGKISSIRRLGNFGKPGRIRIDFGSFYSIDGTPIPLTLGDKSIKQNKSVAFAVGASVAGLIVLGPIGAVAGFFVRGEPAKVEAGSPLFIETGQELTVSGPIATSIAFQPSGNGLQPPAQNPEDLTAPPEPPETSPPEQKQNVSNVGPSKESEIPEVDVVVKPLEDWNGNDTGTPENISPTPTVKPNSGKNENFEQAPGVDVEIKPYEDGGF
ncbi:MAG: hypothetical protein NTX88_03130 [Candidatus Atribacteria bacterium]|nr:hypothetical protein [Candidatus Atribacteria bacterium]